MPTNATAGVVVADLRATDLRLAVASADGPRVWSVPAAAADIGEGIVLGQAARDALLVRPDAGWDHLLARVGDPSPCLVGATWATAAELVASALRAAIPPDAVALRLLVPADWGIQRRQGLLDALVAAELPSPAFVDDVAALSPHLNGGSDARMVLLTIGGASGVARVLDDRQGSWQTEKTVPFGFGEDDIAEAAFAAVSGQIERTAGRPPTTAEARSLASVCALAAERLPHAQRLEIALPDLGLVRVPRAAIEDALRPALGAALAGVAAALASRGLDMPKRILVDGPGSAITSISDAVAELWSADVAVVDTPAAVAALRQDAPGGAPEPASAAPAASQGSSTVVVPGAAQPTVVLPPGEPGVAVRAVEPAVAVPAVVSSGTASATRSASVVRGRRRLGVTVAIIAVLAALAASGVLFGRTLLNAVGSAFRPTAGVAVPASTASVRPTIPTTTATTVTPAPSASALPSPSSAASATTSPATTTTTTTTTTKTTTKATKPPTKPSTTTTVTSATPSGTTTATTTPTDSPTSSATSSTTSTTSAPTTP